MINLDLFHAPAPHFHLNQECAFRKRLVRHWRESIAGYQEALQMLKDAPDEERPAIRESAGRILHSSRVIRELLGEHEREHGCSA